MRSSASDIEKLRQRVLKRNWRFTVVPMIALIVMLAVLAWEVLRQNMPTHESPWKLELLGVGPSATLAGLFVSLILAREQFARTMRPHLSWSVHYRHSDDLNTEAWVAVLMNAGPGMAHVVDTGYIVRFRGDSLLSSSILLRHHEFMYALTAHGFQAGKDYQFPLLTSGAPLPAVKNHTDGIEFATVRESVLRAVESLDFHITIVDSLGDRHAKGLPLIAAIPARVLGPAPGMAGDFVPPSRPTR